jgi:hypothetical protein
MDKASFWKGLPCINHHSVKITLSEGNEISIENNLAENGDNKQP